MLAYVILIALQATTTEPAEAPKEMKPTVDAPREIKPSTDAAKEIRPQAGAPKEVVR